MFLKVRLCAQGVDQVVLYNRYSLKLSLKAINPYKFSPPRLASKQHFEHSLLYQQPAQGTLQECCEQKPSNKSCFAEWRCRSGCWNHKARCCHTETNKQLLPCSLQRHQAYPSLRMTPFIKNTCSNTSSISLCQSRQ